MASVGGRPQHYIKQSFALPAEDALGFEGVFSFFAAFFPEPAGFSSFTAVDSSLGCVVAGASVLGLAGNVSCLTIIGKGTIFTIKEVQLIACFHVEKLQF
jgi:hypothetical protein